MKPVIFWDAKRVPQRDKSGNPIAGKYAGAFGTKVAEGTPGAYRYQGENAAGIKWDFWQKEVTAVRGCLRWIDKQGTDYGTRLLLFIETDKALHRISQPYDIGNLQQAVNCLCGLGRDITDHFLNIDFWVREATDANGNIKTNDQGKPIWQSTLMFRDITPAIPFKEMREFAEKNGLDWIEGRNAQGKKTFDQSAAYKYWDSRLVGIQRFLLNTPTALPFIYNSMTATEIANPSGGGNLTDAEIELCKEIYQHVKGNYKFPFQREDVDADSILDEYAPPAQSPKDPGAEYQEAETANFPFDEPPIQAAQPAEVDDLPF